MVHSLFATSSSSAGCRNVHSYYCQTVARVNNYFAISISRIAKRDEKTIIIMTKTCYYIPTVSLSPPPTVDTNIVAPILVMLFFFFISNFSPKFNYCQIHCL